jgi:23S rRNA pseudouridine1911/1915/1917 synthase
VVGDARYGVPDKRLGSGRFFLHAFKLAFTHPATGERVEFDSPLPEDLQAYLDS